MEKKLSALHSQVAVFQRPLNFVVMYESSQGRNHTSLASVLRTTSLMVNATVSFIRRQVRLTMIVKYFLVFVTSLTKCALKIIRLGPFSRNLEGWGIIMSEDSKSCTQCIPITEMLDSPWKIGKTIYNLFFSYQQIKTNFLSTTTNYPTFTFYMKLQIANSVLSSISISTV